VAEVGDFAAWDAVAALLDHLDWAPLDECRVELPGMLHERLLDGAQVFFSKATALAAAPVSSAHPRCQRPSRRANLADALRLASPMEPLQFSHDAAGTGARAASAARKARADMPSRSCHPGANTPPGTISRTCGWWVGAGRPT
jgi:hypothetical protein